MIQKQNRNMSFSLYISVLAITDTIALLIGKYASACLFYDSFWTSFMKAYPSSPPWTDTPSVGRRSSPWADIPAQIPPRQTPPPGRHLPRQTSPPSPGQTPPPDCHCSGRYVSYRNAFLFFNKESSLYLFTNERY